MESVLLFIGAILIMFGGILMGDVTEGSLSAFIFSIILEVAGFIVILTGASLLYDKGIPAIEVYRGNTELKITYQGGIPTDTIVVYKKK